MTKRPKREVTKSYEPTVRECAAVKASYAKQDEKTPAPRVKIEIEDGFLNIRPVPVTSISNRIPMDGTG